ncbi:MAG: hypothetical protein AAF394_14975 [Planctomycetota bacterium]
MSSLPESEEPRQRSGLFAKLRIAAYVTTGIAILGAYAVQCLTMLPPLEDEHRAVLAELAAVQADVSALDAKRDQLQQANETAEFHGEDLQMILSYCNDLNDLWHNDSPMAIWKVEGRGLMNSNIRLLPPEGDHTLYFRMENWELDSETAKRVPDKPAETTDLEFTLKGSAAYEIALQLPREENAGYRDPRELSLQITSSNPEFTPIKKVLLPERVPPPPGSSTGFFQDSVPVFFPNQIQLNPRDDEPGVLLNRMKWSFATKEKKRFELAFEFRLKSDGPEIVKAEDYTRYFYRKDKKELKYLDRGRYEVLP